MKKFFLLILLFVSSHFAFAQDLDPVKWEYEVIQESDETIIVFTAHIEDGWYLYSQEIEEGGPIPTSFNFETDGAVSFEALAEEKSDFVVDAYDEMFAMNLKKYKHEVVFTYHPTFNEPIENIKGYLEFMCCDNMQCLAPKIIEFTLNLK